MKRVLFIFMALAVAACREEATSQVEEQAVSVFKVHLTVPKRKPNGLAWDRGFKERSAPDIYFCITDSGKRTCIAREDPNRLGCNDSFSCTIPFVELAEKELYFQVIDFDLEDDDLIAQGSCFVPQPCTLGGVTIGFTGQ